MEEMPFLEQIVAMSGSRGGDGHQFIVDSDNSNGEHFGHSYLSGWNLYLDKQTNLDNDLGDVLIDPRTMAPICIAPQSDDQLVDIEKLTSSFEGFDDLPEGMDGASLCKDVQPLFVLPPESLATVPDQPWNREVVLIQIAPTSKQLSLSAPKSKAVDGTRNVVTQTPKPVLVQEERYEKPPFSYSCLIALALKNSESGFLPVSEIYSYILDNFPFFRTAPDGWKNSIRHNLSLNKCFQKLETPSLNGTTRKACLWGLNEDKIARLNEDILKWMRRIPDPKQMITSFKSEIHDTVVKTEPVSARLCEEPKRPVIVRSNAQPSWIGSVSDSADVKLYKVIKVASEGVQPTNKHTEVTIKKEIEDLPDVEPVQLNPISVLEDCRDPMVGGLTIQNGLYDDLTETGELREAAQSFTVTQSPTQSICRHSKESTVTLKAVLGYA